MFSMRLLLLVALSGILNSFNSWAAPITDTVTVDDKIWGQPGLFTQLTWNDVNAVCPGGICNSGSNLNGYDVGGWKWASVSDANSLFNYYLELAGVSGGDLLSGPDAFLQFRSIWAPMFFDSGFNPTASYPEHHYTAGWLFDAVPNSTEKRIGYLSDWFQSTVYRDGVYTWLSNEPTDQFPQLGVLLFQDSYDVSTPSTVFLLSLGAACLVWMRRMYSTTY